MILTYLIPANITFEHKIRFNLFLMSFNSYTTDTLDTFVTARITSQVQIYLLLKANTKKKKFHDPLSTFENNFIKSGKYEKYYCSLIIMLLALDNVEKTFFL